MKLSLDGMKEATKLTQSGNLLEATALIQRLLSKNHNSMFQDSKSAPWQQPLLPAAIPTQAPNVKAPGSNANASYRNVEPKLRTLDGQFESKHYSCESGERSYKLFTPSGHAEEPMPLVVMLHGCTQTPDDFATGTQMNELAGEIGFLVAYPAQSPSANSMGCWNWFKSSDQQKGKGEPALIAGITRRVIAEYNVDATMVYVAGLSAGGAMAAVLGMTYPDLYAAIGVHSGLPSGAAHTMPEAFAAMKRGATRRNLRTSVKPVPTIAFHGDRDRTVSPVNSDKVIQQFDTEGTFPRSVTTSGKSEGSMDYSRSAYLNEVGSPLFEQWVIHGAGHAWSGGSSKGSYTEPRGPNASREMVRFFFQHRLAD